MAERKPLVLINGIIQELPDGDTVPGAGGGSSAPGPTDFWGGTGAYYGHPFPTGRNTSTAVAPNEIIFTVAYLPRDMTIKGVAFRQGSTTIAGKYWRVDLYAPSSTIGTFDFVQALVTDDECYQADHEPDLDGGNLALSAGHHVLGLSHDNTGQIYLFGADEDDTHGVIQDPFEQTIFALGAKKTGWTYGDEPASVTPSGTEYLDTIPLVYLIEA